MTTVPIVYVAQDGGIGDDTTICADTVPAVIGADIRTVEKIAPVLQAKGIAVLALNDIVVGVDHNLDGVYYTDISAPEFKALRKQHSYMQLGVFCGNSRHNAMVMGENGADFIVFDDAQCVSWWATMMEVAVVQDITENQGKAPAKGADFILTPYSDINRF